MITTHNAIRAFMERNMFAPQPRAQPEENFDDLIGETTQGAFTGFPYQDRPHIPEYCGVKKPKGRPPGKHNLRSKGKTTAMPSLAEMKESIAQAHRKAFPAEYAGGARVVESENFDDLI